MCTVCVQCCTDLGPSGLWVFWCLSDVTSSRDVSHGTTRCWLLDQGWTYRCNCKTPRERQDLQIRLLKQMLAFGPALFLQESLSP